MRKVTFTIIIILILFLPLISKDKKEKKLSFEFYSGLSIVNPVDLNSLADYNNGYLNYYDRYYQNYSHAYRWTDSRGIEGEIKSIRMAQSFGGRVRLNLRSEGEFLKKSPKIAFSLGLKYFQSSVESGAGLTYSFIDFYQGAYSITRARDPNHLWIEAFVPQLGIHYTLAENGNFKVEASVMAGYILAKCGSFDQYLYRKVEERGYISEYESIEDLDGEGQGISLEGGIRMNIRIFKSLGVFFEGGFAYQKVNNVSGSAYFKINDQDNNGDGFSEVYQWDGDWKLENNNLGPQPTVDYDGMDTSNITDFTLNLSEFYLRIGISVGLF